MDNSPLSLKSIGLQTESKFIKNASVVKIVNTDSQRNKEAHKFYTFNLSLQSLYHNILIL